MELSPSEVKREADCENLTPAEDSAHKADEQIVIELNDSSVFRIGETFTSYDELLKRLASHSKQSLVHYWRRDSRTVQGAYMKTSRPIQPKLVYYSVKYACVHGGQKFFPRGTGQRNSMTMRTDCPAHIMVRANKSGQLLEVISVCNSHNHAISRELYRMLPQDRRLTPAVKQEVLDMLRMGVERQRVREYVRNSTGKILTNKDLLNLGAGDRRPRATPKPDRAYALLKALDKVNQADVSSPTMEESDRQMDQVEEHTATVLVTDIDQEEPVTWSQPEDEEVLDVREIRDSAINEEDKADGELYDYLLDPIGREVEIFYEETSDGKNMIQCLYPSIEGNEIDTNGIVIENIDFVSSSNSSQPDGGPQTMQVLDHQTIDMATCLANANTNKYSKVKLRVVNIENLDKVFIQQIADGNENTLFQSLVDSMEDGIVNESKVDLRNVLVIDDSISNGNSSSVHMLKINTNQLAQNDQGLISSEIHFEDDENEIKFDDHNLMGDEMQQHCIGELNEVEDHVDNVCDLCGKNGKEVLSELEKLRNERKLLMKENASLRMKRDVLREEIQSEVKNSLTWKKMKRW